MITRSKPSNYWFDYNYQVNLYSGCHFNCIYCDSRNDYYSKDDFNIVQTKKDALKIMEHELSTKYIRGVIGTGAMCDAYNYLEAKLEITKNFLLLAYINDVGVHILTKSNLVTRDIEILTKLSKTQKVSVFMSITTFDDELSKKIDRNAPVTSLRFAALKELNDAGITTGIVLMPIIPFVNDTSENIINIVNKANEVGTKMIWPGFNLTLRGNQKEYFLNYLKKDFNIIYDKFIKYYANTYNVKSFNKSLYKVFVTECLKYNITYRYNDINKTLFK